MDKLKLACSRSLLIIGVLLILVSSVLLVSITVQISDGPDQDHLDYTTWINEKREMMKALDIEDISQISNDIEINKPETRMAYAGGGALLWKSEVLPGSEEYVSTPLLEDLDGDGDMEVVAFTSSDAVMAFNDDGSTYWRAPYTDVVLDYLGQTAGTSGLDFDPPHFFPSPKSFDPNDGDGPRILVPSKDGMYCLDKDGQQIWSGGGTVGYYFSTPAITDIEGKFAGDLSDWEIIIASDDQGRRGWIEVFDLNGTLLSREEAPSGGEGSLIGCAVVAEDLDGSYWEGPWKRDIITDEEVNMEVIIGNHDRGLRIWDKVSTNDDGGPDLKERTDGWLAGHQTYATHAVANVSGGPELELFAGSAEGYCRCCHGWGGKVYAYTPDGKKLWDYSTGSSGASVFSSPVLADMQMAKLDPDEVHLDYELVFGADTGKIYVMNTEFHSLLWSFDTKARVLSSPAVCDIYNDNQLEIIVGSDSGKVFCFDGDPSDNIDEGISYPGDSMIQDVLWVYDAGNPIGLSSPVVADINLDGVLEVVIGDLKGNVHCISAGGICVKGRKEWTSFHLNNNNTGFYNPDHSSFVDIHPTIHGDGQKENTSIALKPGESHIFDLTVDNKGANEVTQRNLFYIDYDEDSLPDGWKILIDTPILNGNEDPDHIEIRDGESARILVTIWTPLEASEPTTAQIVIKVNHSVDTWVRDEILLQVNLRVNTEVEVHFDHPLDNDLISPRQGSKWEAISQGGQYDVEVEILNTGTINDTFQLILSEPPKESGWDWYFRGTDLWKMDVTLMAPHLLGAFPGKSREKFTVRIHCPDEAIADTDIVLSLKARSLRANEMFGIDVENSDDLHLVVSEDNGLLLDIVDNGILCMPGSWVEIPLRVTNLGNKEAVVVMLDNDTLMKDWQIELNNEPIVVFRGQTRTIPIFVTTPSDALAGTSLIVTIRGTIKEELHITSKASVIVRIDQVHSTRVSMVGEAIKEDLPGNKVNFDLVLMNYGNGDERFSFEPMIPEEWTLDVLDSKNRKVDDLLLDPYSQETLKMHVQIPENTLTDLYKMHLVIHIDDQIDFLSFEVKVKHVRGFKLLTLDGETNIVFGARINKETRFRCSIENTGNGIDTTDIIIGGQGAYGSLIELPAGTRAGLFSISQHSDQKGDPTYWNTSRPLDLTVFSPNKLFIPERKLFGGPLSGNEPVTDFAIKLAPGGKAYLEIWVKQGIDREGIPVESTNLMVTSLAKDVREILPVKIEFSYPDLYFVGGIEVAGSSGDDELKANEGDRLTFIVKIGNRGETNAQDVVVELYIDNRPVANITLPFVPMSNPGSKLAILTWEAKEGKHNVRIVLDPSGSIIEKDDLQADIDSQNNVIGTNVKVKGSGFSLSTEAIIAITATAGVLILVAIIAAYISSKRRNGS